MSKAKIGDGVFFVAFTNTEEADETLKKWPIVRDADDNEYTIFDVLDNRDRWAAVPVTFRKNDLNLTFERPCSIDELKEYIDTIGSYLGNSGVAVGCTWIGKSANFNVVYNLGSGQKSFLAKIDTFMPLKTAKEEFFTLREVLYRATIEQLFGEETKNLSESEMEWLTRFAPID